MAKINSSSTTTILGRLQQNDMTKGKELLKLATGQKLNSAGDDTSGYTISERMRVRLRALDKANENTKTGYNMLDTASAAVQEQLDLMRTIKEKVINAHNDSNTDADRLTIQKEIDHNLQQIQDIAYETTYTIQGVFVYKYPVTDPEPFTVDKLVGKRNEVLKANVPGMFDNTYMTTADYVRPEMKFLSYHDHHFAQLRGFWEVEGDFMGGPFVSHSFYSKDGRDIIVLEGWVYAPKYDKRQYLRQVESFLYSFEWDKDEDPAGAGEDEGKK